MLVASLSCHMGVGGEVGTPVLRGHMGHGGSWDWVSFHQLLKETFLPQLERGLGQRVQWPLGLQGTGGGEQTGGHRASW